MRRLGRALGRGLLGLVGLVAVAALGLAGLLWWALPPAHDIAAIPGLSAPARILLDADGIPHIEADSAADAAAALGYVHARDRMFQMELGRRMAAGRLSELFGPATLRLDRMNRTLGLLRSAQAEYARLDPPTRALLAAYASGVNAWIAHRGRFAGPEFLWLGRPEPWTAEDSLLWGKTMALYLAGNWRDELARLPLLARMGPAQVRALWPAQNRPLPSEAWADQARRLAAALPTFPERFTLPDTASNEWAVDGTHSQTGRPLLAGDPHLAYNFPAIWYLARIQTPQGVMAGATAPGVPFMVLGHNGHIAWTFTATGADTEDLFIETPAGPGLYMTPDGPAPFATREERIVVRGQPDQMMTVRETRHGPVVSDLDPSPGGPLLAVSMAALAAQGSAADGLLALNRAQTVAEAGATAALITAPVQNLLVAGPDGIGQFMTGRIPLRREGDGALPVPGADGTHDWAGFAQGDQLPHRVNPASGHLLNANERPAPPDFPVFLGRDWFGEWRSRRIRDLLMARPRHSLDSFAAIQTDATSLFAQAVLPRLLRLQTSDPAMRAALEGLAGWDGTMAMDRPQPLLFNAWMRGLERRLRERFGVPSDLRNGDGADMIARALGPQEARWCGPDCDALLQETLGAAVREAGGRGWGTVHSARFRHPLLGQIPRIGPWFDIEIPQPGDATTVFRGSPGPLGWAAAHGPAYRGLYDLADLDRSRFALAPGQSGNPLRAGARALLGRWRDGTSVTMGPTLVPVETIELLP